MLYSIGDNRRFIIDPRFSSGHEATVTCLDTGETGVVDRVYLKPTRLSSLGEVEAILRLHPPVDPPKELASFTTLTTIFSRVLEADTAFIALGFGDLTVVHEFPVDHEAMITNQDDIRLREGIDPLFFLRNHCPTFVPTPKQGELIEAMVNNRNVLCNKSMAIGASTALEFYIIWRMLVATNERLLVVTPYAKEQYQSFRTILQRFGVNDNDIGTFNRMALAFPNGNSVAWVRGNFLDYAAMVCDTVIIDELVELSDDALTLLTYADNVLDGRPNPHLVVVSSHLGRLFSEDRWHKIEMTDTIENMEDN